MTHSQTPPGDPGAAPLAAGRPLRRNPAAPGPIASGPTASGPHGTGGTAREA
ncbi:hypothetical protein [Streptomyces dangxiongensis]|uniref:hypothetical protein n=1 Tax=Streptomyces dangxiongensis TaxID=1442032 RepID=UPI0013CEB0B2|nr:hypothetical protein [Streptomyces dangxiongensis]